jgi:hypothetical protein
MYLLQSNQNRKDFLLAIPYETRQVVEAVVLWVAMIQNVADGRLRHELQKRAVRNIALA